MLLYPPTDTKPRHPFLSCDFKQAKSPAETELYFFRRRLMKYYFEDKNYEQIAQEEGCSFQMVAKSVKAAIRNLKKILR